MENFIEKIEAYLKENGGRTGASKKSYPAIQAAMKDNGAEAGRGELEKGRMYSFRYFDATHLPYDTWPVVIGLGLSNSKNQLAINLHYIPYDTRVQFVDTFIKSYETSIINETLGGKANNVKKQSSIDIVEYNQIKRSFGKMYNITYAIREYRMDRIRNPICLSYENWHIGTVNDENYFMKSNINEAQSNYFKK